MLSLSEAKKSDHLEEFIAEQEAAGVGPIDRAEFDGAVSEVVKAPPPKGQTSHSAYVGNSSGIRTRRDTDQDASR